MDPRLRGDDGKKRKLSLPLAGRVTQSARWHATTWSTFSTPTPDPFPQGGGELESASIRDGAARVTKSDGSGDEPDRKARVSPRGYCPKQTSPTSSLPSTGRGRGGVMSRVSFSPISVASRARCHSAKSRPDRYPPPLPPSRKREGNKAATASGLSMLCLPCAGPTIAGNSSRDGAASGLAA